MDSLTPEKIRHISSLSMIRLSEEEERAVIEEVNSILAYFEVVTGFRGSAEEKGGIMSCGRKDETQSHPEDVSALILNNFPKKRGSILVVPRGD